MEGNLQEMFPEEKLEKKPPDYKLILEYLQLLKSAIDEMDIDKADEISEKLNSYEYPDEMIFIVEMLDLSVRNIDAEQVTEYGNQLETRIRQL